MPEEKPCWNRRQGSVKAAMAADGGGLRAGARRVCRRQGIDVDALAARLQVKGAESFVKSWTELMKAYRREERRIGDILSPGVNRLPVIRRRRRRWSTCRNSSPPIYSERPDPAIAASAGLLRHLRPSGQFVRYQLQRTACARHQARPSASNRRPSEHRRAAVSSRLRHSRTVGAGVRQCRSRLLAGERRGTDDFIGRRIHSDAPPSRTPSHLQPGRESGLRGRHRQSPVRTQSSQ